MFSARLAHRIDIDMSAPSQDAVGGVVTQWVPWLEGEPASVEPLRGQELWAAAQVQSKLSVRIRIRWRPGVLTTMRVRHRVSVDSPAVERVYAIEQVIHVNERRRELQLMCVERESDGWRTAHGA